jgi:hypothetical protein
MPRETRALQTQYNDFGVNGMPLKSEDGGRRSGLDRRGTVDPRNPELQSWIRRFWNRYYKDNPEKNRRTNSDRRKSNPNGLFARIRHLFSRKPI